MSSVEFVAAAAKYYIVHRIIRAVMPFIIFPALFLFGARAVFVTLGLAAAGLVLYVIFVVLRLLVREIL